MPNIAKTVHEGRTQPIIFTLKDSGGTAINLGNYFKIGLIIKQGTRRLYVDTSSNSDRLTIISPASDGKIMFFPLEEDPINPTYQAGDQGLHTHVFRLYTTDTQWFGVPDGKYLLIRAITT